MTKSISINRFPTTMQAKVVNKPEGKRTTIITGGYGSGKSTALIFKALQNEARDSVIIYPCHRLAHYAFESAYKFLKPLGFRASRTSMILSHDTLSKKIKFGNGENHESLLGIGRDLIMFDNPQWCRRETVYYHMSRANEMVFTSTVADSNELVYTECEDTFVVDHDKSSWCSLLLDKKHLGSCSDGWTKVITPNMFRDEVYLVGDGNERSEWGL
jgi:hypothetical protein